MAEFPKPRDAFAAFVEADTVEATAAAFEAIQVATDSVDLEFSALFDALESKLAPSLPFRQKRFFSGLAEMKKNRAVALNDFRPQSDVLISGAGPVGLRSAIEAAVLGMSVRVVEKRQDFSRANILLLWEPTHADLVSLGAKFFVPSLPSHGLLHMGTREMQLALLKTALLLGVQVQYGAELFGLAAMSGDLWEGRLRPYAKRRSVAAASEGLKHAEAAEALGFKADKTGDYEKTFKCNAMLRAEVDPTFLVDDGDSIEDGETRARFNCLLIAEGESSTATTALGFCKTVDRFTQALGLVINLRYNTSDANEKKLASFAQSKQSITWKAGVLGELHARGVEAEAIEYLKGTTHYIALSVKKATLLSSGAIREDRTSSSELLTAANIDVEKLRSLARTTAAACGLPDTAEFFSHNPVQLFDYSTRARAILPCKVLVGGGEGGGRVLDGTLSAASAHPAAALVIPVGDAMLEPFWPQGLGSNRGMHSGINAVWAAAVQTRASLAEAVREVGFGFQCLTCSTFMKASVNPGKAWRTDPATRFSPGLLGLARKTVLERGLEEDQLPDRIRDANIKGGSTYPYW